MVFRLAWEAPGQFAGFAAIGAHLPRPEERACRPAGVAVSMLLVSGTDDPINPWHGGAVRIHGSGSPGAVLPAEETATYFRELAGLPEPPSRRDYLDDDPDDGTIVERRSWRLPGRRAVTLVVVHGGGHTLPLVDSGFPFEITGRTSREFDGAEVIWRFLEEQFQDDLRGAGVRYCVASPAPDRRPLRAIRRRGSYRGRRGNRYRSPARRCFPGRRRRRDSATSVRGQLEKTPDETGLSRPYTVGSGLARSASMSHDRLAVRSRQALTRARFSAAC
jgi:hypothetical protein